MADTTQSPTDSIFAELRAKFPPTPIVETDHAKRLEEELRFYEERRRQAAEMEASFLKQCYSHKVDLF